MRVWEVDNNAAMSSELVLEQDFILRVRRMQRHGNPCLVLNFVLNAVDHLAKNQGAFEAVQAKLKEFAQVTNAFYFPMSNGDVFIVWEETHDPHILSARIVEAILPDHSADTAKFLLTYKMPADYNALRERTNHYVEIVRAGASVGHQGMGRIDDAQGPLTARSLDQIGNLIGEIDLYHYGRTQHIYRHANGEWQAIGEEYFISFEDLRRERFPKLEVVASEHFFMALCGMIDQRLLAMMTKTYDKVGGRMINLNLSVTSVVGNVFAQFVHRVPREQRHLIGFELHRGDLLQDFSLTLSAIAMLKREGFRVALDSITPDMVNYLDLTAFAVDAIKINVSKDRALQLIDKKIRTGLERISPEKLIFFRCDNERALSIGTELGVSMFQGWLIDDMASKKV